MSAVLAVATNFFPLPVGIKSYTVKDDAVYYDLTSALSFSFFDQLVYRGRNYRDLLDAGAIGRGWSNGAIIVSPPPVLSHVAEVEDDRVQHELPRNEPQKVTWLIFWSGATGAGNVIAAVPEALFEQFSPNPPTRY